MFLDLSTSNSKCDKYIFAILKLVAALENHRITESLSSMYTYATLIDQLKLNMCHTYVPREDAPTIWNYIFAIPMKSSTFAGSCSLKIELGIAGLWIQFADQWRPESLEVYTTQNTKLLCAT